MLPNPLHPAIVHFPLALALLVPLAALAVMLLQRLGLVTARAWLAVLALQVLLAASGLVAVRTGEADEERVEEVVAERRIEEHEERAERFATLAGVTVLAVAATLVAGRLQPFVAAGALVMTAFVAVAAVRVGHSGGELVYRHGAASAFVESVGSASDAHAGDTRDSHRRHEDDDD